MGDSTDAPYTSIFFLGLPCRPSGAGFKDIKHFKPSFREGLAAAPWHPAARAKWRPSALNLSLIRAT